MKNEIDNQSGDGKYFVMTPEIVLAKADVFERSFWQTVKMICGDKGKCTAGLELLASLAKMSQGKASEVRQSCIDKGLLLGGPMDKDKKTSPWKLVVPNFWKENIAWREEVGDSLHDRAAAYSAFSDKNGSSSLNEEQNSSSRGEKNFSLSEEKDFEKKRSKNRKTKSLIKKDSSSLSEIKNIITNKEEPLKEYPAPKNGATTSPPRDLTGEEKQPTEWQILFVTLAEICGMDIKIGQNAGRVGRTLKELLKATTKPTERLLRDHYGDPEIGNNGWNWYKHEWRGKDKAPTLSQVVETWGNWKIIKSHQNGTSKNGAPAIGYNLPPEDLAEKTLRELGYV